MKIDQIDELNIYQYSIFQAYDKFISPFRLMTLCCELLLERFLPQTDMIFFAVI